jgi:hypothetical protein
MLINASLSRIRIFFLTGIDELIRQLGEQHLSLTNLRELAQDTDLMTFVHAGSLPGVSGTFVRYFRSLPVMAAGLDGLAPHLRRSTR